MLWCAFEPCEVRHTHQSGTDIERQSKVLAAFQGRSTRPSTCSNDKVRKLKGHILVVDDNKINRMIATRY